MANDINMFEDIETFEKQGEVEISNRLLECYNAKYIDNDMKKAELLKEQFIELFKFWGNWY